jgi:predicted DNA-binding protein (MmcQ/YjbR family)
MSIEELHAYCTSFKGVSQDIKWGADLCYSVGNKMFCVIDTDHNHAVAFKTSPEEFFRLTEREGIVPAPYTARYHWILVENLSALKINEWKMYIRKSYELVFAKLPVKEKLKFK